MAALHDFWLSRALGRKPRCIDCALEAGNYRQMSLARSLQAVSVVSLKFLASYFGLSSRAGITNRRSPFVFAQGRLSTPFASLRPLRMTALM